MTQVLIKYQLPLVSSTHIHTHIHTHSLVENIYYDFDALSSGNYSGMDAKNVLLTKKGVCEGYANLVAALLRSQNIPCRIQSGYALGIDTNQEWNSTNISTTDGNHAWNEVYTKEKGWITVSFYLDTIGYNLVDPTFYSNMDDSKDAAQYIGNGSNYQTYHIY